MDNLNINLDCMANSEELMEVSEVLDRLAAYAKIKARAMQDRANGAIEDALAQERQCEIIYKHLPEWPRR